MATIISAKEYNSQTENPVMRFRTESGKERETGYVVKHDNGTSSWWPNRGLAKRHKDDSPETTAVI